MMDLEEATWYLPLGSTLVNERIRREIFVRAWRALDAPGTLADAASVYAHIPKCQEREGAGINGIVTSKGFEWLPVNEVQGFLAKERYSDATRVRFAGGTKKSCFTLCRLGSE